VTDYWLDDGYVEFVSDDSVPSHIPLDALDLQKQSSKTLLVAFLLCFDPCPKTAVESCRLGKRGRPQAQPFLGIGRHSSIST
jgi:hypothetical protein